MKVTKAKELLKRHEVAAVVFTRGPLFHFDATGNGETGNWVVDPEMIDEVDKIIVYLKDSTGKKVFMGNYSGIRQSSEQGRYIIRFSKLVEVGTTESNWYEFAGGGQNPVCYVDG